jgi:hypothetical protein
MSYGNSNKKRKRNSAEDGLKVVKREDEAFSQMWKRFSKKQKMLGFWDDIKKNKFYVKESVRKREAKKRGIINAKIAEKKRFTNNK